MAQMMSIQLKIWKRLITNQAPLSFHHIPKTISPLASLAIYVKPHFKLLNFCTETAVPSTTPPDRGVVTEFFLNKCSLTEEDITKAFKYCNYYLRFESVQNCEEVLELLNGCGLTTPAQIRRVTLCNPVIFFYKNMKSQLSFLRTFMEEEDIAKLICRNAKCINHGEDKLKSAVSLLRKLGLDSEEISELVAKDPRFLMSSEKYVLESFKEAEDLGIEKGSKMFAYAWQAILGLGKEKLYLRRLCLARLGFSGKQISDILKRHPMVLGLSEDKVKRNMDFLVNSAELPLAALVKYPSMFGHSLEKKIIPRYRVIEALKSMEVLKIKTSLPQVCSLSETRFLKKYIHSNADLSSALLNIYYGGKVDH